MSANTNYCISIEDVDVDTNLNFGGDWNSPAGSGNGGYYFSTWSVDSNDFIYYIYGLAPSNPIAYAVDLTQGIDFNQGSVLVGSTFKNDKPLALGFSGSNLIQSTFNVLESSGIAFSGSTIIGASFTVMSSLNAGFASSVDVLHSVLAGVAYFVDLTVGTIFNSAIDIYQGLRFYSDLTLGFIFGSSVDSSYNVGLVFGIEYLAFILAIVAIALAASKKD
jgi:hypothetical protein